MPGYNGVLVRKIIPAVVAGATVLAVAGGTFAYVSVNKDVTLAVDGWPRPHDDMTGTVADFLGTQGIAVSDRDVVAPGPRPGLPTGRASRSSTAAR